MVKQMKQTKQTKRIRTIYYYFFVAMMLAVFGQTSLAYAQTAVFDRPVNNIKTAESNDVAYVAYTTDSSSEEGSYKISVVKLMDGTWQYVGEPRFSNACAQDDRSDFIMNTKMSLSVYNGTPYVSYVTESNNKIEIYRYDGSSWNALDSIVLSDSTNSECSLYVYQGTPYLAYSVFISTSTEGTIYIQKYDTATGSLGWNSVGLPSNGGGNYYFDTVKGKTLYSSSTVGINLFVVEGVPYISYNNATSKTGSLNLGGYVLCANGTSWEFMGCTNTSPFSVEGAYYSRIFKYGGDFYLSYENYEEGCIDKYNSTGNSWEAITTKIFAPNAYAISTYITSDGSIYSAYSYNDGSNGYGGLGKWNATSSSWEPVGSNLISNTDVLQMTYSNGIPYVIYCDVATKMMHIEDKKPPVLTKGSASRTGDTTATVTFITDEDGQYYYSIVDDGETAPTIDTSTTGTACSEGKVSLSLTGLSSGAKDIYICLKDTGRNNSNEIQIDIPNDYSAPVPGNTGTITTSNLSDQSLDLAWTLATDDVTAKENLQYKVVYSTTNNIPSVEDAQTNGTIAMDWKNNANSYSMTGLSQNTKYYFVVLVKDASGNIGAYNEININTKATTYSITYHLDGGTNHADNAATYTYETGLTLKAPTKDNYTFAGWYSNAEFTGSEVTSITTTESGAKEFYAKWTVISYSITYHLNGGTNHADNVATYTYGTGLTLKAPTKDSYTFAGWYDNAEFTGSAVTSISSTESGAKEFYAKWTVVSYSITYHLNGGTNHADNAATYTYGAGLTLKAPTKANYTFAGWYDNAEFTGSAVTSITTTESGAKEFYAKWTDASYGITYHLNGGTNATENVASYTYGKGLSLKAATKENYEFAGWYDNAEFTGSAVTSISSTDSGAKTFYAKWTDASYGITYNLNGGTNATENVASYTYGTGLSLKAATKENYEFAGWYDNDSFTGTAITSIGTTDSGAKTFYAKWTDASYGITYNLNGGTNATDNEASYTYGTGLSLKAATKENYEFAGWYDNAEFTGSAVTSIGSTDSGAKIFYAKWTDASYGITYNLNGGTNATENVASYTYGTGLSLKTAIKENYEFAGWYDNAEFTGSAVTSIGSTDSGAKTFYAKWTDASYGITYNLNGGTNATDNAASYTYGTGLSLKAATKENYEFAGWYDNAEFTGSAVTSISSTDSGAKTFYAKWTDASYGITYNLNGGTNATENVASYTYGTGLSLKAATKENYEFAGWYDNAEFTGSAVTSISSTDSGAKTFYAKWTDASYAITYHLNGGTNATENVASYTYGKGLSLKAATKENYEFVGWYDNAEFTGSAVTSISSTDSGAKTFYAKWTDASYGITYNLNGGTNATENVASYTYGKGLSLKAATKENYEFAGWYDNDSFTGTAITSISSTDSGAKTFYAKWTDASYGITYNLNGGTNATDNAARYTYGTGLSLKAATKENYEFAGWYDNAEFTGSAVTSIGSTESGAKEFYAKWTEASYAITYHLNGGTNATENVASYTYGKGLSLKVATKENYEFAGWYDNDSFTGTAITSIGSTDSGAKIFYAKWTDASYGITYNLNGGTNATDNAASYTYGKGLSLKAATKENYEFAGWYDNAEFTGSAVTSIGSTDSGAKTFYAKWTENSKPVVPPAVVVTVNDSTNKIVGADTTMEYFIGTATSEAIWISYDPTNEPVFDGNKTVMIRKKASGNNLAGEITTIVFTENIIPPVIPAAPSVTVNDATNKIVGADATMEYFVGTATSEAIWISYDPTNEPVFAGNLTVKIRKKASGTNSAGKITTITFTETVIPYTPSTPAASTEVEKIAVDVKLGETEDTASNITIERTTDSTGKKSDKVTYQSQKAEDTVNKLKEAKEEEARIVIPYTEDEISDTTVSIPSNSVDILSKGDVNLKIDTQDVKIEIPKKSLQYTSENSKEDLYFRLVPVREGKEQSEIEQRAKVEITRKNDEGNNISVIGVPVTIETNMPSSRVDITLPLNGIEIPSGQKDRKAFLSQLAVYIEHSDGEKELVEGKIVEYKNGIMGIKFSVTKFSIFTIVKTDAFTKSSSCEIKKVTTPKQAKIKGREISATVNNQTTAISVNISVSKNATWRIYRDKKCTKKIAGKRVKLSEGRNKVYLKVTAEDGKTSKIYTLQITRKKAAKKVVIVATKYDFADATAGSVLAGQLNGKIVRTGITEQDAKKLTAYIKKHYKTSDEIYIIGLGKAVNGKLLNLLKKAGYKQIKSIGGSDKYETAARIAREIILPKHAKVVLINGAIKPKELNAIQKTCAKNGYPILYVKKDSLGKYTKEVLKEIKPEEVYLIGGKTAISDKVVDELKMLLDMTEDKVRRDFNK